MTSIEIQFKRTSKIYNPGDKVSGIVILNCDKETSHQGISLTMKGNINLQLSAKNTGVFDSFYKSIKPMNMIHVTSDLCTSPGKLPAGQIELPFEYPLDCHGDQQHNSQNSMLYETFHGVYVNIQYSMEVVVKRSLLTRDINKVCEFIVENKRGPISEIKGHFKPLRFAITSDSIQTKDRRVSKISAFKITGELNNAECAINEPIQGSLVVHESIDPLKSIELQLMRVETCGCAEGFATDAIHS